MYCNINTSQQCLNLWINQRVTDKKTAVKAVKASTENPNVGSLDVPVLRFFFFPGSSSEGSGRKHGRGRYMMSNCWGWRTSLCACDMPFFVFVRFHVALSQVEME